jgi:hypothetical protein
MYDIYSYFSQYMQDICQKVIFCMICKRMILMATQQAIQFVCDLSLRFCHNSQDKVVNIVQQLCSLY